MNKNINNVVELTEKELEGVVGGATAKTQAEAHLTFELKSSGGTKYSTIRRSCA